jgi:transcriptional regulator with XRE-family HTH domain
MKSNVVRLVPVDDTRNLARKPQAIEVMVGDAWRTERLRAGFTQQRLGDSVGVTFQQIQKVEQGKNRLYVSRLLASASVLGFDPGVFVNDLYDGVLAEGAMSARAETAKHLNTPGALELIKLYNALTGNQRKVVLSMLRELAGEDDQA